MMDPPSSVCGLYFANEKAKYFDVYKVDKDQLEDYAKRNKSDIKDLKYRMPHILL